MATVELGDVSFDPTSGQDFRLSLEGTSGTGKSNSLRVILEDLADVNIPTLIVERLGAITPVRFEDENIVVVGGRDEEGIDLTVPLESLDLIGELVLDRGMKVLLDVSTYSDYEEERSRIHLATARAVRSLNDRAHEKYRSGDRTLSLLVIDEAHWLAPKNNVTDPDIDEWVKRARGQIVKACTEGGNKGISTIVAYQRRAFLHNGVLQLVNDYVAHQPGTEDIDRTASALGADPDTLRGLGTGEIVARGPALTDGELVGPTKVRRCRSPDPREETFTLPETPPEVTEVLEGIQEEVAAEQEHRQQRQDELERLRSRVETLEEKREQLERDLADQERLARAMEQMQSGGGPDAEVAEQVSELKNRLKDTEEKNNAQAYEISALKNDVLEREEEIERLEARLAETKDLEEFRDEFLTLAERFGADVETPETPAADPEVVKNLKGRVDELETERDQLKARLERADGDVDVPTDYEDFLTDAVVQEQIEESKSTDKTSPRYVKGVLATILEEQGPVTREEVGERLGISNLAHVSTAANVLVTRKVLKEADTSGRKKAWDLNIDGIREVKEAKAKRERTEAAMQKI